MHGTARATGVFPRGSGVSLAHAKNMHVSMMRIMTANQKLYKRSAAHDEDSDSHGDPNDDDTGPSKPNA
eukprot:5263098-Amphidinium_carterae.1